jgi:hypothetical protein
MDGKQFLIAKAEDPVIFTQTWVNLAYAHHIPCVLFYEPDISLYLEMTMDPARWPAPDNDPTLKVIDRLLGTPRRAVHAIMLGITNARYTPNWLITFGQHILDKAWQRYRLPLYLYMDSNPWTVANDTERLALNMYTNRQEGMSTVDFNAAHTWPQFPSNLQQTLGQKGMDMVKWYFWLHHYNDADKSIDVRYNGDLYADIGYQPTGTTPSTNPLTIEQRVERIEAYLGSWKAQ